MAAGCWCGRGAGPGDAAVGVWGQGQTAVGVGVVAAPADQAAVAGVGRSGRVGDEAVDVALWGPDRAAGSGARGSRGWTNQVRPADGSCCDVHRRFGVEPPAVACESWASYGGSKVEPRERMDAPLRGSDTLERHCRRLIQRVAIHRARAEGSQDLTLHSVRTRWVPGVLAVCLAVSSCSGSDKGAPTVLPILPTRSPSPAPTPSVTTSSAPVIVPSPARPATPQGAAAFVRFYLGRVSAAYATADPGLLEGLSDVACATCARYAESARLLRVDGKHIVGQSVVVVSVEAPAATNGFVAADVFFDVPSRAVADRAGHLIEQLGSRPRAHQPFFLQRRGESWSVRAVKQAA